MSVGRASLVRTPEASIIFYIHIFGETMFIFYQADLSQLRVIFLNTFGGKLYFWHKLVTLPFGTIIQWMYTSLSLYFKFHVQKYQLWGRKIPNGALSRDLNLPNDKESNAVSQTAVQPALCPEASNSCPDWPEDIGIGKVCRDNVFELNFYYFSPGSSAYPELIIMYL